MTQVLIVADNPVAAAALLQFLQRVGHSAVLATTPRQALEAVTRYRPDLLVVDLREPDGWALVRQLARDAGAPPVPVLLVTAHTNAEDVRVARGLGVRRVFDTKRFSLTALAEEIAAIARPGSSA